MFSSNLAHMQLQYDGTYSIFQNKKQLHRCKEEEKMEYKCHYTLKMNESLMKGVHTDQVTLNYTPYRDFSLKEQWNASEAML